MGTAVKTSPVPLIFRIEMNPRAGCQFKNMQIREMPDGGEAPSRFGGSSAPSWRLTPSKTSWSERGPTRPKLTQRVVPPLMIEGPPEGGYPTDHSPSQP